MGQTSQIVAASVALINGTTATQAEKDSINNPAQAAWKALGYTEIVAGVLGLTFGTLSYIFGGIIAYVITGLDVVMIGVIGYLMFNFSL